ncbi:hypothetical protein DAI22_01g008608 [Oryza sativa Japonica Group]|nr:hypothetical protein DAI22_01g008608 [Oryza sativa Japonica Group]
MTPSVIATVSRSGRIYKPDVFNALFFLLLKRKCSTGSKYDTLRDRSLVLKGMESKYHNFIVAFSKDDLWTSSNDGIRVF